MKIKKYAALSYFIMFCCFLGVHIVFFKNPVFAIFGTRLPLLTSLLFSGISLSLCVSVLFFLSFLLSVISFKYDIPGISIIQNKTMLIIINIFGLIGIILSLVGAYLPMTILPTTIK